MNCCLDVIISLPIINKYTVENGSKLHGFAVFINCLYCSSGVSPDTKINHMNKARICLQFLQCTLLSHGLFSELIFYCSVH